ncbi:MAG TPA: hypothetical protein VHJ99_07710 [Candidatus Dormibacteraeota bacterium]|nr:hypothetical protein [Candidatus Dormibacteraeota bacterium]
MITETRRGVPGGAFPWSPGSRSPRVPTAFPSDPDEVTLGRALAARVSEATRITAEAAVATGLVELSSPRFARSIHDVHTLTSRAIARFLITGEGTTERERNFISRLGVIGACYGMSVATMTRSYLLWRDTNLRILNEEASRLGIGQAVSTVVRKIIQSSADTGILRMVRAYDDQMRIVRRAGRPESNFQQAQMQHLDR